MWSVVRFAEVHRYRIVIVENVPDARHWDAWETWVQAMRRLGYAERTLYLNSRFFGAPQSRDRLYAVFWKVGDETPDLEFRPSAICDRCGRIEAVQSFKTSCWGRYRFQYFYRCPHCAKAVFPSCRGVSEAIDWQIPAPLIGGRTKPLQPKTLDRINQGRCKYPQSLSLVLTTRGTHPLRCVSEPLSTVTACAPQHWLLIAPAADAHVEECGLRILEPCELQAAMAFDPNYLICGNKRQQLRQLGNAVTPPVMAWIVLRCVDALTSSR
jgi:DNA (cytosine-5)-methyltransferase 1